MNINDLFRDPWFISGVTFLATVLAVPLMSSAVRWIRSRKGPFSGHFVALTYYENWPSILVEEVKCRHIGTRLTGSILGVLTISLASQSGSIEANKAKYKFNGFVDERTLVLSYQSTLRGVHSVGSYALQGDTAGQIFAGEWVGLAARFHISCALFVLVRIPRRISRAGAHDSIDAQNRYVQDFAEMVPRSPRLIGIGHPEESELRLLETIMSRIDSYLRQSVPEPSPTQ